MKRRRCVFVMAMIALCSLSVFATETTFMAFDPSSQNMIAVVRSDQPFNAIITYQQSNDQGWIGDVETYQVSSTEAWAEGEISPVDRERFTDIGDGVINIITAVIQLYDENDNLLYTYETNDTLVTEREGEGGRYVYREGGCSPILPPIIPDPRENPGGWSFCAYICHATYAIPIFCEGPYIDPQDIEVTVSNGCDPRFTHCDSVECPQIDWNLFAWYKRVFPGCNLYLIMAYCNGNPGCVCIWRSDFILPVQMNGFSAVAGNRQVTLNWSTASESDLIEFRLTRSDYRDGTYGEVARVAASNETGGARYTWTDEGLVNGKTYYYKLHVIDATGAHVYNDGAEAVIVEATPYDMIPAEFSLAQNYPNPFNSRTTFAFTIPSSEHVTLKVYDLLGREVATVVDRDLTANSYEIAWSADGLTSGVYMYTVSAGTYTDSKKLLFLK